MAPHLSTQRVEEYRQRVLPEAELLAVDSHLAVCEDCRQRVGANIEVATVLSDFHHRLVSDVPEIESEHLSYEQFEALVDSELKTNERDALQIHLEACKSCEEEVNDLRAFRAQLRGSTTEDTSRAIKPSFSEKFRSLIDGQRLSFRLAFAALALLLIAASVALFQAWRASRRSQPAFHTTNSAPSPEPTIMAKAPSPQQEPTPDERFVVTLNDGGKRVTVDVNGNVDGLAPLPGASSQVVRRALTTGKVAVPDLSELIGIKGRLMGTGSDRHAFSLTYPVGTVTRNTRPTLRWRPLTGATSYTVAILDASYNVVTTSPPLTTTSWTPTVELDRGRVYLWQVTSLKDGKQHLSPVAPEPEARFKVLEKATVDELISVEKTGNSHLVRGTMYARAGLLDEAEKELRALLAANPNSKLARELLQSVRAKRRR